MAATMAIARTVEKSGREKQTHRLGSYRAEGQANTYNTFTSVVVHADGHGWVEVKRNGDLIHSYEFGPE